MALIWMFIGVNFYSFMIGSIESSISGELKNKETLAFKLRELDIIKDTTEMDPELYYNITVFLQNNYSLMYGKVDEDKLQSELPKNLYEEVIFHQYKGLISTIKLFKLYDIEFVWGMV